MTSPITGTKETAASNDSESTTYQQFPEITPEIYEVESTDPSSIGLLLRAIYEGGDMSKFSRALDHRITQCNKEIKRICYHHHQQFIESIQQLGPLKEKFAAIKEEAAEIDSAIQSSSAEMTARAEEIVTCRKKVRNAMAAIDYISRCLPILDSYARLNEMMRENKYYQALKVLEELEHTHNLDVKYSFMKGLEDGTVPLRKEIEKRAYSEFTDFLEHIKKVARRIGRQAMIDCICEMPSFDVTAADRVKRVQEETMRNAARVKVALASDGALINQDEGGEKRERRPSEFEESGQRCAQDLVDCAPIHRCSQIFCVLGKKDEFERYYRRQREQQCAIVCATPSKTSTLTQYVHWLDEIVGFFIIEDQIHLGEFTLVTDTHTEILWEKAASAVLVTLSARFVDFCDVELMIGLKKAVRLFALTMKSYGYDVTRIKELLSYFTEKYAEVLRREYEARFVRDLKSDNYTPITVENEEEYRLIVSQFPFHKRSIEKEDFPLKLAFSRLVVSMHAQAKNYLDHCLTFMANLQMSHAEMEDTLRRFANMLLVRWSECMKQCIRNNRTLGQLVQLTINTVYMEEACESIGPFITKIVNRGETPEYSPGHEVDLCEKVFGDARTEAEQEIEEGLRRKVDLFMENTCYDWELSSSSGRPSDYMFDLLAFLSASFSSFTNLPNAVARHVCIQICKHVADSLLSLLVSPHLRSISRGALDQLSLDVMQCEVFAARSPVEGMDLQMLPVTFAMIRQLLNLVASDDWTTFITEYRSATKMYDRVKINDVIVVLEKKMEWEKKAGGLFAMKSNERRKFLESVLRQLRILAAKR